MTIPLQTLERQTVQEFEPKESLGAASWYVLPANNPLDDTLLPEWGLHQRDRELRLLYRNQFNWIAQSAVAALIRKFTQTPNEVKGGRNLVSYFQNMLQDAEFGGGWSDFSAKWLLDYLTCDYGAYWEIIGGGKPDRELKGRVTGIAHLDSLRCIPTGNLEFPVVYWSRRSGKLHRLHHTRVQRLVDMPDGDEMRFGPGMCSLSRAVAMIQQQIPMMKYVAGQMSDVPANGVMFLKGITATNYTKAMNQYKLERESKGYKGPAVMSGESTAQEVGGTYIPFAVAPQGFDYATYIDIAVNAFAAAFGIDRQDLWPLQGKMAGTATQSEVMAAKAMGMAYGDLLSKVKRAINTRVLPPSMELDFEYRDEEKDKQVAERTTILLNNATTLKSLGVTDEVIIRYLAAQDETLRDVLLNKKGEIIALPDDDVVEMENIPDSTDALADETTVADDESETPTAPDAQVAADGTKKKTLSAYAYIPLGNNIDVLRIQRQLKERLTDERIEWQIPATFHVTLCYADGITDEAITSIGEQIALQEFEMETVQGEEIAYFDTPDGKALHIAVLHTNRLDELQANVYNAFNANGAEISELSNPQSYSPHITLAYLPNDVDFRIQDYQEIAESASEFYIPVNQVIIGRNDYDPLLILQAPNHIKSRKDISDTQAEFERRFSSILRSGRNNEINRTRAGILIRGLLRTSIGRAYGDGMEEGGVPRNQMDTEDNARIAELVAAQSQYVSNLTDILFNQDGITDAEASGKAIMWFNKSVNPAFDSGRMSASANAMYEFRVGNTEHCDDCLYLNGQIHRLKAFIQSGWYPKSSKLDCKGFRCECELIKRPGAAARGRLPSGSKIIHIHQPHAA